MGRYCLRYQNVDLRLGSKDFVVGRSSDCDLVVDDTLVSRRHAAFRVDGEAVEVRDLGSRNGVLLNGKRISGPARMRHGDRAMVGSQELLLRDVDQTRPVAGTAELMRCSGCGAFVQSTVDACPECGTNLTRLRDTQPSERPEPSPPAPSTSSTPATPSARAGGSLGAVAQLADKALSLGRGDEAERMLAGPLQSLLARVPGQAADTETLETAARCALRLADATQKSTWIDFVFDLLSAADTLMSADLVEEVYKSTERVHYTTPRALRAYLARMKAGSRALTAGDRFLLQRLDGLERRIVG